MSDEPPDWRLRAWMTHFDKKRSTLQSELGWEGKRAHDIWHGKQPYKRQDVNQVAQWLGIEVFELFLEPKHAIALRSLRDTARIIVELSK